MFIKKGNRYIVDNMKDLPVKDLQIGDHVISFKDDDTGHYGYDLGLHESTYTMVFESKFNNELFTFDGHKMIADIQTEYDENYQDENGDYVILETYAAAKEKHIQEHYLKLNNDELFSLTGFSERRHDNSLIGQTFSIIYDTIFNEKLWLSLKIGDNKFAMQDVVFEFMPFRLTDDVYIVFTSGNNINAEKRIWAKELKVYLMYRKRQIFELNVPFRTLFSKMKKISEIICPDSLEKFEQTLVMMNKDILKEVKKQSEHILQKELDHYFYNYYSVKNITSPFYENKEINLKAYPNEYVSRIFRKIEIFVNNSKVSFHTKHNLDNEFRKANAIFKFEYDSRDKEGISPYDGKYYLKNEVVENKHIFVDYEGIIQYGNNRHHNKIEENRYVRIDDLYVEAISPNDDDTINRVRERRIMVEQMLAEN